MPNPWILQLPTIAHSTLFLSLSHTHFQISLKKGLKNKTQLSLRSYSHLLMNLWNFETFWSETWIFDKRDRQDVSEEHRFRDRVLQQRRGWRFHPWTPQSGSKLSRLGVGKVLHLSSGKSSNIHAHKGCYFWTTAITEITKICNKNWQCTSKFMWSNRRREM